MKKDLLVQMDQEDLKYIKMDGELFAILNLMLRALKSFANKWDIMKVILWEK